MRENQTYLMACECPETWTPQSDLPKCTDSTILGRCADVYNGQYSGYGCCGTYDVSCCVNQKPCDKMGKCYTPKRICSGCLKCEQKPCYYMQKRDDAKLEYFTNEPSNTNFEIVLIAIIFVIVVSVIIWFVYNDESCKTVTTLHP